MKKPLAAALVCLTAALALTLAAGMGFWDRLGAPDPSAPAVSPAPSASLTAAPASAAPAALADEETLSYFSAVVFSTEYGGSSEDDNRLRRWEEPLLITVDGSPTDEDLAVLNRHIGDLQAVPGMPEIRRVRSGGNVAIHFVPLSAMGNAVPGYVEGNWGFFRVWWDESLRMNRAEVAIASDVTTQPQRNHLILEEVTQLLGLMQDADSHADSIFYGPWTETQALSALDWRLVALLYRTDLSAGMTREAVMNQFTQEGVK